MCSAFNCECAKLLILIFEKETASYDSLLKRLACQCETMQRKPYSFNVYHGSRWSRVYILTNCTITKPVLLYQFNHEHPRHLSRPFGMTYFDATFIFNFKRTDANALIYHTIPNPESTQKDSKCCRKTCDSSILFSTQTSKSSLQFNNHFFLQSILSASVRADRLLAGPFRLLLGRSHNASS